jgi:carbamoyl-phosphate synthase large subunit
LITGAGAPGIRGTLYALRNNPEGLPLRLVGVDAEADVVGRFLVDSFYQVPPPEDCTYLETLAGICKKEAITILIPQTTREISVLAHCRQSLLREGIRTLVSNAAAIEIANNKWRLLQEFQALGLPAPACRLARCEKELTESAACLGYPEQPVVVKPPLSNGMRGIRVLKEDAWDVQRFLNEKPSGLEISLEELIRALRRGPGWPELLVMEYLPGSEYTVDAFLGERTAVAIPRLRKSIRSGITFEAILEFRHDLTEYSLRAAKQIGLQYAFGFQFKLDSKSVPKILECNPRIQGTMVASSFSGLNVIWLAVKEALGEPPPQPRLSLREAAFYRFWGGLGVCGNHVYEI